MTQQELEVFVKAIGSALRPVLAGYKTKISDLELANKELSGRILELEAQRAAAEVPRGVR